MLSPEDRMSRMLIKLTDYEAMGIRTIRVIEPETGVISRFEQGVLQPTESTIEQLPAAFVPSTGPIVQQLLDL